MTDHARATALLTEWAEQRQFPRPGLTPGQADDLRARITALLAEEREACAQVAEARAATLDELAEGARRLNEHRSAVEWTQRAGEARIVAAAIRKRGEG